MIAVLLRNLELILTAAGLLVIFAVTAWATPQGVSHWQVAAITATLVGVVHGLIFWVVRRRQRTVREQTLREIQAMLKDVINNELTIIHGMSFLRSNNPANQQRANEEMERSINTISEALHSLSEESVRNWHNRYRRQSDGRVPEGAAIDSR